MMKTSEPSHTLTPEMNRWKDRGIHFTLLAERLLDEYKGLEQAGRLGLALQKIEYRAYEGGYAIGRRDAMKQIKFMLVAGILVGFGIGFLVT